MTYTIILLIPRKPGVSLDAFKHHWETAHVPLLKRLVGHDFPLSHTRHYFERNYNVPELPNMAFGDEVGIGYDGMAVLTFANREHYGRFMEKLHDPKADQEHAEDLDRFADIKTAKGILVDDTRATGRDGGMVGWTFVGSV